jgi:hypothetical protein
MALGERYNKFNLIVAQYFIKHESLEINTVKTELISIIGGLTTLTSHQPIFH